MYERKVPVLFIVFNRPDKTQQVLDKIREAKPEKLFVAADGPREHKPEDKEMCEKTRKIIQQVDWDCEVKTLFRDKNSGGSGMGVSGALQWFFDQVEEGIILEDDCVPNMSFFYFCQEMLKKYRYDNRVMHISGSNFQFGNTRGDGTYYFSKVVNVWGWATWKRAWKYFDYEMKLYPALIENRVMRNVYASPKIQKEYERTFGYAFDGTWKCWDRRWMQAVYVNNGLSIIPNKNLISNIGFGKDASDEYYEDDKVIMMPTEKITTIKDPSFVVPDREADEYYHKHAFVHPPLFKRVKRKLHKMLHKA